MFGARLESNCSMLASPSSCKYPEFTVQACQTLACQRCAVLNTLDSHKCNCQSDRQICLSKHDNGLSLLSASLSENGMSSGKSLGVQDAITLSPLHVCGLGRKRSWIWPITFFRARLIRQLVEVGVVWCNTSISTQLNTETSKKLVPQLENWTGSDACGLLSWS